MADDNTITRAFAWARAYLAVHNTMAAKMCLRRVMKSSAPKDMPGGSQDAIQLATDIATQYMLDGNVDEAADLLEFAASWAHGELDVRSKASGEEAVGAENPSKRHASEQPPKQPPKPPPKPKDHEPSEGELTTTVGRFEEDVTRIYRPGQTRTASGTVITHTVMRFRPNVDPVVVGEPLARATENQAPRPAFRLPPQRVQQRRH